MANIIIGDPKAQRPVPDTDWGHFHLDRARFAGTELACRLAMNGYQDLLHNYQPRN